MKITTFRLVLLSAAFASAGFPQPAPVEIAPPKPAPAVKPAPAKPLLKGFPFTNESLSYTVNWPSGLSLGDAHMSATSTASGWKFEFTLDAGIPAFTVKDSFHSTATRDNLCSESFTKNYQHGAHKSNETVTVDSAAAQATRTPANGLGSSKYTVPGCVRDALSFLYYARRELGQGRVPTAQEIIFGGIYYASFEYGGAATIVVASKQVLSDKMICHIKGPASDITFEAYFDRDPARTPLSVRVPLPLGKFSLELVR